MAITDGIITLEEAKESLNIAPSVTGSDELIERYVEAATSPIERITGPIVERERAFTFNGGSDNYSLPVRVASVDGVEDSGDLVTGFTLDQRASIVYFDSRTSYGIQNLVITCTVGYDDADDYPANVKLMARELVRHWWQQGHQGNRPSFGNEATDNPSMIFGVPTRRLEELMGESQGLPGFA